MVRGCASGRDQIKGMVNGADGIRQVTPSAPPAGPLRKHPRPQAQASIPDPERRIILVFALGGVCPYHIKNGLLADPIQGASQGISFRSCCLAGRDRDKWAIFQGDSSNWFRAVGTAYISSTPVLWPICLLCSHIIAIQLTCKTNRHDSFVSIPPR